METFTWLDSQVADLQTKLDVAAAEMASLSQAYSLVQQANTELRRDIASARADSV